ncbi:hypothetical protein D3C80_1523630 [compost metagenome]
MAITLHDAVAYLPFQRAIGLAIGENGGTQIRRRTMKTVNDLLWNVIAKYRTFGSCDRQTFMQISQCQFRDIPA